MEAGRRAEAGLAGKLGGASSGRSRKAGLPQGRRCQVGGDLLFTGRLVMMHMREAKASPPR